MKEGGICLQYSHEWKSRAEQEAKEALCKTKVQKWSARDIAAPQLQMRVSRMKSPSISYFMFPYSLIPWSLDPSILLIRGFLPTSTWAIIDHGPWSMSIESEHRVRVSSMRSTIDYRLSSDMDRDNKVEILKAGQWFHDFDPVFLQWSNRIWYPWKMIVWNMMDYYEYDIIDR